MSEDGILEAYLKERTADESQAVYFSDPLNLPPTEESKDPFNLPPAEELKSKRQF